MSRNRPGHVPDVSAIINLSWLSGEIVANTWTCPSICPDHPFVVGAPRTPTILLGHCPGRFHDQELNEIPDRGTSWQCLEPCPPCVIQALQRRCYKTRTIIMVQVSRYMGKVYTFINVVFTQIYNPYTRVPMLFLVPIDKHNSLIGVKSVAPSTSMVVDNVHTLHFDEMQEHCCQSTLQNQREYLPDEKCDSSNLGYQAPLQANLRRLRINETITFDI